MENGQGLQYRIKDGPTMQFWPARQHEFFQGSTCNNITPPQSSHIDALPSHSLANEAANLQNFPLSWDHIARLDDQNGDATGSKNWSQSWEWDYVRLTGHPSSDGNDRNVQLNSHGGQGGLHEFSSPSPPEENGAPFEPTLLEFGLTSKTPPANDEDGLLDLKLGGNGHSSGACEPSPSLKRSRHSPPENQQARCQVENCSADLQNAKDYHRRHKVCEHHAKASNALVGGSLQRFCQQCSRFHLLSEFDDDRRSCRKRLAGHNRRRRKTQPDAATALACLLADQSVLARIIGSAGQQQAKDELETLLQGSPLLQTLWTAKLAGEKAAESSKPTAVESALPSALINSLSKSQLLGNLLLSNPALACTLPAMQAPPSVSLPTEALISALSSALLASLPQLQQKASADLGQGGQGGFIPVQETGQPREPHISTSAGLHSATKQNSHSRYSVEERSRFAGIPSSMERPPQLPTTPPVHSDSNGDSMDERLQFDTCQQTGSREGLAHQQGRRHWKARKKTCDDTTVIPPRRNFQIARENRSKGAVFPEMHTSPLDDHFETAAGLSDPSSDSGLDKPQEQTGSLWFKIFDKNPSDLPPSLRNQILEWLELLPTDMEGHIKPGCIILTILVCMPVYAWEKICRNIERSLQKLVSISDGDFWRKGRVLACFGETSAFIIDGKVYPNFNFQPLHIPTLILVQPFAIVVGETKNLILTGRNLKNPGTRLTCAFEGKCIYKETDFLVSVHENNRDIHEGSAESTVELEVHQEQAVTFEVGPFNNSGRSIIEVERQSLCGNAVPIIIADKSVCDEINLLGSTFAKSCDENNEQTRTSLSGRKANITHFLHELGWLLQRVQQKRDLVELKVAEFSATRYRWLLRFSVTHSLCAVTGRILDTLFRSDDVSTEHAHSSRAREVLSDVNLLHVAVKNKSRAMVEYLVMYASPTDSKRECLFRPDTPICDGFTPLHVAAGMRSADDIVDALTNVPEQLWANAWMNGKDSFGQTPLMYALKNENHSYVKKVQDKLVKMGASSGTKLPYLALNIGSDATFSPKKTLLSTKQIELCNCRPRATGSFPLQVRGLNKGFMQRSLVVTMLAVAAVCVCVGVIMRGAPKVNYLHAPFVWDNVRFGPI